MKFCAASMASSIACLLLLSTVLRARFMPSFASASIAADSFFSWAFKALISLTRSLFEWAARPFARMSILRAARVNPAQTTPPASGGFVPISAVPDVLWHRQLGEIRCHQRLIVADAFLLQQHHVLADMLAGVPRRPLHQLMEGLRPVVGVERLGRRGVTVGPPVAEAPANLLTVGDQRIRVGVGRGLLAEHRLDELDTLVGAEERVDDAEQMEGQGAIAAWAPRHMSSETVIGHQRDELQGGAHEFVDACGELLGRELRPAILVEAEEV